MSPPDENHQTIRLQDHLSNVLYEPDRIYKRLAVVTIRFKNDGETAEKCSNILKKTVKRYVDFPAGSANIDIVVDSSKAIKHPSGHDATIQVREEIENRVFHQLFEQISDHDPKLIICYVVGKGAILRDPQDGQMIPKTPRHEFYAICSNEIANPTFIHYKYLLQDILINPKLAQFPSRRHRRFIQTTDVFLLLDCLYEGPPFQNTSARNRTVEIISGWNQSHFINRFCKSVQHIVRVDHVLPEPCRIYETMIYGRPSVPKFNRVVGSSPILLPLIPHDDRKPSEQAVKYLEEDFDSYPTCQIFIPMEISFFGSSNSKLLRAFANWITILQVLVDTKLSFVRKEKVYAAHERELEISDRKAKMRLYTFMLLVPFRYQNRFLDLHLKCGITVKPLDQEPRSTVLKLCNAFNGAQIIEVNLGEWIEGMESLLRKEIEEKAEERKQVKDLEKGNAPKRPKGKGKGN
ncbi:hypothetical protein ABW20_dc0105068 [Dactylellina cionopaga]|nr:hypothetical protein ABW20_dc0105068 [Dactylellina cionopaga]